MLGYEEFGISLSFHFVYLLLALFIIAGYTFFTYKYTVPPTGKFQKVILVIIRTTALLLLLLILFEPILNLIKKENIKPSNFVFIDNSRSITIEDQTKREENTLIIAEELSKVSDASNLNFYTFGSDVNEIPSDSISKIAFNDGVTDISEIFTSIKKDEVNLSSIILISDGVFNTGSNPYYSAIKAGVPVLTIGIGDTTRRKDIEIKKVLYNEMVYAETPTTIAATIQHYGFAGQEVTVDLNEGEKLISSKKIKLSSTGIQKTTFDYNPESSGERKLSVLITGLNGEFTKANNIKIFYLNVLSNKIKVLLLTSSPSSDLSFIRNSLKKDENLTVNSITQISSVNFLKDLNYSIVDSADILFLIGFPSETTPEGLWKRVQNKIIIGKIPYFLTLSANISYNKLINIKPELSFTINQITSGYKQVQPEIPPEFHDHPIIQHRSSRVLMDWNNLPPVLQPNNIFKAKPESKVISKVKFNNKLMNSPLILIRNFSERKSVTILAKEIWKWKLQTATKKSNLFDSFILNAVKWLNASDEQQRMKIISSKKNYSQGERIEFSAQVLDESLNPVSDAEVKVKINSYKNSYESDLQLIDNGIYEGSIAVNEVGDFNFTGEIFRKGVKIGDDKGTFNIGEIDLETIEPVMNYNLLKLIAEETGGKYYSVKNYSEVLEHIAQINKSTSKEKISKSEIKLWSSEWMLIFAILLFSLEWFIRKRIGLI
jgi:hypothetical protein